MFEKPDMAMNKIPDDPIGAAWLVRHYGLHVMTPLVQTSQIGSRRASHVADDRCLETYLEIVRPQATPAAHLQFHLRREFPNLEFLSRLFVRSGPDFVQEWINAEPTGQYARRAAFFYEWLGHGELEVPARIGGNYADVIDAARIIAASPNREQKVARWRLNDNLPGTRWFCPIIPKMKQVEAAAALDIPAMFAQLTAEFGEDLLQRAAAWMTLRESKASFAIEGESDRVSRIQRFADVMARRTGDGRLPLQADALADLQQEILGSTTTIEHFGLRQSPVFVGERRMFQEIVHYVAPPADQVAAMLEGLQTFEARTTGQSSVMRSAVTAFGFVYIHPMADGNGRVHRFLINDVLRRDGAVPAPVILPVSAVITDDAGERRAYDNILDTISKPLMQAVREHVRFAEVQEKYPDGVISNFEFEGNALAEPLWRYPDMGAHVVYMSHILARTLNEQMREESRFLRRHTRARQAIKEIVEMPDHQVDRVLRSIDQNQGALSNVLAKEMPVLLRPGIWTALVEAVDQVHKAEAQIDSAVTDRYRPERPIGH